MKILIIDDEPLIRRSLGRALKSRHHDIFEADDGLNGLQIWLSLDPDIVVLDVLMPGLTGPQVIAKARAEATSLKAKVVLISAYTGENRPEGHSLQGADLFISKPFQDIFAVVDQIEAVVDIKKK